MQKKLTKHGNSLALVIDKPILELLGIDAKTLLSITTDGKCLIIVPVQDSARQKRFRAALRHGIRKFDGELKKLAD